MIAILSDIHGNYPALKVVMEFLDEKHCEQLILLGDIAGYYCMINECIDLLREKKVLIKIMGNHDFYLTQGKECPRSSSANVCLNYQRQVITKTNLEWLKNSITIYENDKLSAVHGGWNNFLDEYLEAANIGQVLKKKQHLFLSGHTHVQMKIEKDGKIYCNPGSVGQPRDGDRRSAFAIVDNENNILLYRTEYDIDLIAQEMKTLGFTPKFYENLYFGKRIGDV